MLRVLMFGGFLVAFLSAFALYSISTQTRRLAAHVDAQRRHKLELTKSIAILKAERAFRARAEVIAPLARKLGMRPLSGGQMTQLSDLPPRPGASGLAGGSASGHTRRAQ